MVNCLLEAINKNENYIDNIDIDKILNINNNSNIDTVTCIINKYIEGNKILSLSQIQKLIQKLKTNDEKIIGPYIQILENMKIKIKDYDYYNKICHIIQIEKNSNINKDILKFLKKYIDENTFLPNRYLKKIILGLKNENLLNGCLDLLSLIFKKDMKIKEENIKIILEEKKAIIKLLPKFSILIKLKKKYY